jgi:hypothetical protein
MRFVSKLLLVTCLVVNVAAAYDFRKKTTVTVFKGFGKNPYALKLNQFRNEVDLILYGCLDSSGRVNGVSCAQDYNALAPVKLTIGLPDNGIKIEKKYSGYNETYLMKSVDTSLRLAGLLPREDYKKDFKDDFLMAEYKKGQPIKLVLSTSEYLAVITDYLVTKLEVEGVVHPASKPLLFIELESGDLDDQANLDLLGKYFEIAGPADEEASLFFEKNEKRIGKIISGFDGFHQVGQLYGEMLAQFFEKDLEKGDPRRLSIKFIKLIILALTIVLVEKVLKENVIDPAEGKIKGYARNARAWAGQYVSFIAPSPGSVPELAK